jgi:transposase
MTASTHEVRISVVTDHARLIRFARIAGKHTGALAADLEQLQEPELIAGRKPLLNDCKACQASADGLRTVTPAMYCPGCRLPATGTIRVRSGQ